MADSHRIPPDQEAPSSRSSIDSTKFRSVAADLAVSENQHQATSDQAGSTIDTRPTDSIPSTIGRYRVRRLLGEGGFGRVFEAYDEQLQRAVAVKIPHMRFFLTADQAELYLTEARVVAGLDHPHIVPVYDVGCTDGFPCFVVSKLIDGPNLEQLIAQQPFTKRKAAELCASVAEALHYAHTRGLVHRDVKPGNILIGPNGHAYVVDFGLALREDTSRDEFQFAGTPAYMSPEQANGEGHRVDRRSDVFSLGVVFYVMLSGRRPFMAESGEELLKQIAEFEPVSLLQIDATIPEELERICFKSLSKQPSDRYATAQELADDLRWWLAEQQRVDSEDPTLPSTLVGANTARVFGNEAFRLTPDSLKRAQDRSPQIVPKGLRSFDAHDASFFLELLPGPRDRHGLPESLRFWKNRIEEKAPEQTFAIGLLYGPSGCGKTSLVRAGLLPRLATDVVSIYVEATPTETEASLLKRLQSRFPNLNVEANLQETLTAIRRGNCLASPQKVVIILDQFEQWLHATSQLEGSELIQALRQCDGGRLQCLVMVRDDFWMAATRFVHELDLRLLEGENSASVDVFSTRHAERVLMAFGRAFGIDADKATQTSDELPSFIRRAVAELAENGRVVCVRLALFAEMMKDRPWSVKSLKALGGLQGVGARFLEECFRGSTAPLEYRLHQRAAQRVLQALLPDAGSNIKGELKSYDQLLKVSGYTGHEQDFHRLIRILDVELKLISPADRDGSDADERKPEVSESREDLNGRCYQLTHDYLVPSLREWLTRKQRETRQGRAELLLADRASLWEHKPESRNLPWTREWLRIRLLTDRSRWTDTQRRMMEAAGRVNGRFWGVVAVALTITLIAGQMTWSRVHAAAQRQNAQTTVSNLETASSSEVPAILKAMDLLPREFVLDELDAHFADSSGRHRLRLACGLAHYDRYEVDAIVAAIVDPDTPQTEGASILEALSSCQNLALPRLRTAATLASEKADYLIKARIALICMYLGDSSIAQEMLSCEPGHESLTEYELPKLLETFKSQVEALAVFPTIKRDGTEMQFTRARALFYLDEFEEALDILEHLASASNVDPEVLALQAICLARTGRTEALQVVKNRLVTSTDDEHFRAYAFILADAYAGSIAQAESAVRAFADSDRKASHNLYHAARISSQLARAYAQSNPPEAAKCRQLSLDLLRRAHDEMGDQQFPRADVEPDFISLHQEPEFQSFVKERYPLAPFFDPEQRTRLIKLFEEWKCDLIGLAELMHDVEEPAFTSGIALAIGGVKSPSDEAKSAWNDLLYRWCHDTPDPGTSNAALWVLRTWDLPVPEASDSPELPRDRDWWRSPELSMVRIPAGSVNTGAGTIIVRDDYWISDHEITLGVFEHFVQVCSLDLRPFEWEGCRDFGTGDEYRFPAQRVGWFDAILFCNWLSLEHGLNPCYDVHRNGDLLDVDLIPDGNGYRLPTEEEWEYACRAGSSTQFSFGDDATDLEAYAWIDIDSEFRPHEVGTKRCNAYGLFDMHGNVWEWCWRDSPQLDRIARGGAWSDWFGRCSSSFRLLKDATNYRASGLGLRVVRACAE